MSAQSLDEPKFQVDYHVSEFLIPPPKKHS